MTACGRRLIHPAGVTSSKGTPRGQSSSAHLTVVSFFRVSWQMDGLARVLRHSGSPKHPTHSVRRAGLASDALRDRRGVLVGAGSGRPPMPWRAVLDAAWHALHHTESTPDLMRRTALRCNKWTLPAFPAPFILLP